MLDVFQNRNDLRILGFNSNEIAFYSCVFVVGLLFWENTESSLGLILDFYGKILVNFVGNCFICLYVEIVRQWLSLVAFLNSHLAALILCTLRSPRRNFDGLCRVWRRLISQRSPYCDYHFKCTYHILINMKWFFQTELSGIKWRKLVWCESGGGSSGEPLDDPVLRSYARCLAADILCVWRRVSAPQAANLFDLGPPPPTQPPPLSLAAAKELWIFWYGEEPDLSELVAIELLTPGECSRFV